jgi:hypothetical protein
MNPNPRKEVLCHGQREKREDRTVSVWSHLGVVIGRGGDRQRETLLREIISTSWEIPFFNQKKYYKNRGL